MLNNLKSNLSSFKGLDPKKIWMWPTFPRVGVLSSVTIVTIILGYLFLVNPEQNALVEAESKMETLKTDYQDKYTMAANLDSYKKMRQETEVVFGESLRQLPSKSEMESLLNDIHQAGLGRGLNFELFKPNPQENMFEFYAELPIQLQVEGTYHDIAEFNAAIARLSRIVTINDINLNIAQSKPSGKGQEVPLLKMKMTATAKTYRYLDDTEVKEQQKAKAAANKGKPGAKK